MWRHAWWVSLLVLPFLVIWPVYAGLSADPIFMQSGLLTGGSPGWVDGLSNLDLNVGATTQALGHLAAEQWLRGQVPWWNPYNGVGMPLAGEMQASALFLPFILLLHFQNGPLLIKIAMQMIAGPAMFVLLRRLAVTPAPAWLGGLIFALNGSFAWLGHGPIMPVAFLPLFLIGIENARSGGFRLIALALALSIYAGFPETAYLDGLLALAWAVVRLWQSTEKLRFAGAVAAGGILGLLLAAPALWSFAHMLMHATAANHAVFNFELDSPPAPAALYAVWLFPYLIGPLQTFTAADPAGGMDELISNLGGYAGLATLMLALSALTGRSQRALRWMLAAWIVACVLRIAAVPGATEAINLIPLLRQTIMSRYAIVTCQCAVLVLAALALSDWRAGEITRRRVALACVLALAMAAATLALAWPQLHRLALNRADFAIWPEASVLWGLLLSGTVAALLWHRPGRIRLAGMLALLAADAAAMFTLPMLSNPRHATIDMQAVRFLHDHAGTQRFYTLGPYRPNYGAYFETAQLNHEYLPLPALWADYIPRALDPYAPVIQFRGDAPPTPPGQPTHADELVTNLANYAALGVRYVVTPPGRNPFAATFATAPDTPHVSTHPLHPGQSAEGRVEGAVVPGGRISALGVELATFLGQSNGTLTLELCGESQCTHGSLDTAGAADNAIASIELHPPLEVKAGEALRWRIAHEGGNYAFALWLPGGPDSEPRLSFTLERGLNAPPRVYRDRILDIYELPDAAPYFETQGANCQLIFTGRTEAAAQCDGPAMLIRRELFFSGWRAEVNGLPAEITPYHSLVQQIGLPSGASIVAFHYAPPLARTCWTLAGLAALVLLINMSPRRGSTRPGA